MNTPFRMAGMVVLAVLATACAQRERMGGGPEWRSDASAFEYWQLDPCARGEPELPAVGRGLRRPAGKDVIGTATAGGTGEAAPSGAFGWMGGMGAMGGGAWARCVAGLDLSAEQRARIDQIREQAQAENWKLMREMHARARPGMGMGNPPAAASEDEQRRAYDEAAALHRRLFESRLATRGRVLEVLTPAQREQVDRECPGLR